MEKLNIIFDACKLKYGNTGLYYFTQELARALEKEDISIRYFIPPKISGLLPSGAGWIKAVFRDRFFPVVVEKNAVWHSPYQLSPYMPCKGVKAVITVHDLNFLYEKEGKKRIAYLRALKRNLKHADHIVAISEYTRQDLLRHVDVGNTPVSVIYNGCNIYSGEITPPAAPPSGAFLFGVGTILPKKNWHVLPCLLQGNDDTLLLAGKLSGYAERIMQEAENRGVKERIKLLGEISEGEKHWYLQHCRAFLFPSLAEGFGLPVIEAMYYGKPVFLSKHTSLPEIGKQHAYYFNDRFDREEMVREFRAGMDDFGRNGNSRALKEYAMSYSWEQAAKQYVEVYKQVYLNR